MSVTEVWLYGSTARGDRAEDSDVDILIAGEGEIDVQSLNPSSRGDLSLSRYSWAEIENMAQYGSLFPHHIRLEGRPLVESDERRLRAILSSLRAYSRASQELDCFSRVLDDVEIALTQDHSVVYELAVVATAARHAAILGCYLIGEPDFGRS